MSIERLRALEKAVELVAKATPGPWQQVGSTHSYGIGGDFTPGAFSLVAGGTSGKDCDAVVAAVNFIREHGSALIAELGQEVGAVEPVGYMDPDADFMLPRKGQCVLSSHVVLVRDPHGKYTRPIYLSPAHTSEARDAEDAARYRWLRNEAHKVKHMSPAVILATAKFDVSDEECGGFEFGEGLDKVIDAAMRQEGGTP